MAIALALATVLIGCSGDRQVRRSVAAPASTVTVPSSPAVTAPVTTAPTTSPTTTPDMVKAATTTLKRPTTVTVTAPASQASGPIDVPYRLDRRTTDAATDGFADVVTSTLADRRGWQRAGFVLHPTSDATYAVILAEPDEAQELCRPYDVYRKYSCQNGPLVVLNAERWRSATPEWTGDLATYRQMLVNHEVGHLLGLHHPDVQCPTAGVPARVMAQQSTELDGCSPNPWPLDVEIAEAARHDQPLAPPYNR